MAFAARAPVAAVAALVMACSSGSSPVSSAGTDSGAGSPGPAAQDSGADAAGDASTVSCTRIGYACESFTVCCNGGTCVAGAAGSAVCTGVDSGPGACLTAGQPCSATESCCNGAGNCGEGTTNTCE
jgi:hypothetical protein